MRYDTNAISVMAAVSWILENR